jgi:hypothetical protein
VGIFVEEQDDLASRTLARVAVLQPLGAIAKDVLAARATDLNGIFHDGLKMSARSLRASPSMKHIVDQKSAKHAAMAIPAGFEPATRGVAIFLAASNVDGLKQH